MGAHPVAEVECRTLSLTLLLNYFRCTSCFKNCAHIVKCSTPILRCDNLSSISLALNPIFHANIKLIEVDYHVVQENVVHKEY